MYSLEINYINFIINTISTTNLKQNIVISLLNYYRN